MILKALETSRHASSDGLDIKTTSETLIAM